MGFTSQLYPGEQIFDDATPAPDTPSGQSRGLIDLSLVRPDGYAYSGIAKPFPKELLIPRNDWQAWIQEMEERKTRTSDLVKQAGLQCKNQQSTSYCWINAPVYCQEVKRVVQNQSLVVLSPASAGAQIKNFRNVGGWGREGLEWLVEHGCCPVENWPANAIDRRYATEENKALALKYRVDEWYELQPRNLDEHVSALLRRIPCAVGLNYWGHEVSDEDAIWLDGEIAIRFRNSWGMVWGSEGYGVRQGNKRFADDIVDPATVYAS